MESDLVRRQTVVDDDYCYYWWDCSTAAFIVKWVIVGVIFAIFILWFVGGYFHAKRRVKKGLPPLAYHRFLLSRRDRARFSPIPPPQNNVSFYDPQSGRYDAQGYPMQPWVAPPPAYGEQAYVPPYPGAAGGSKVNPDQNLSNPDLNYAPPAGPPPAAAARAATTIRELDHAEKQGSETTSMPASSAGPSRAYHATVEEAK